MNSYTASADGPYAQSWSASVRSSYPASPKQLSSSSSWGTVYSKSSVGTATPVSFGPSGPLSDESSWGSQTTLINSPYGSWPASPSGSYIGSSASSTTLVSPAVPVGAQGVCITRGIFPSTDLNHRDPIVIALPHLGHPAQGVVSLNPALQDTRLAFNFANPPPPPSPSESQIYSICHSSAFYPSMSYAQVNFEGFPHWIIRMELPQALTVFTILQHIYQYLQEPDMQGTQNSQPAAHTHHQMSYSRDPRSSFAHSCLSKKRITCLGSKTLFGGLSPAPGANSWTIRFIRASR